MFSQAASRRHADADRHLQARHRSRISRSSWCRTASTRRCRACREVTQQLGVTTIKSSPDLTMVVHLISPDDRYDMLYLRNYAVLNVKDQLAKIEGVGSVQLFGSGDYAMRIWLNPEKIAERDLTADDVVNAIRQPERAGRGRRHQRPALWPERASCSCRSTSQGRLSDPEQFGDIIIKRDERRGHAAERRGADRDRRLGIRPALAARQQAGRRHPDLPGARLQRHPDLRPGPRHHGGAEEEFPARASTTRIVYDPTVFVRDSIKAVVHTLLEARGCWSCWW